MILITAEQWEMLTSESERNKSDMNLLQTKKKIFLKCPSPKKLKSTYSPVNQQAMFLREILNKKAKQSKKKYNNQRIPTAIILFTTLCKMRVCHYPYTLP